MFATSSYQAKGPRMAKSVDDRGRDARMARHDEGAYCWYVTEEQRSQPGLKILHLKLAHHRLA